MKILIFIHSLLGGGAERVAANLANHWAEQGNDVTVVTVTTADTDFYQVKPAVKRIGLNLDAPLKPGTSPRTARSKIARIFALRKILKTQKPDIALSMMIEANLTLALAGLGLGTTAKIGAERTHPPQTKQGVIKELLRKWLYGQLDAVVALTSQSADWVRTNTHAKKVVVIPNAVVWPLPNMHPHINPRERLQTNKKHLLAVGRLAPEKQFDRLIEIFAKLAPELPHWDLAVLGEGPEQQRLSRLIKDLNLECRIHLAGRVGNMADWYESADLFVLCSRFEGFPNSLAEAMAHGLPSISFDCDTGPRDIIRHDIDGLLVPAGDDAELQRALRLLMENETKRRDFSKRCLDIGDRFSAKRISKLWQDLFDELVD